MSGRRARALRAAFKAAYGRPPNKTRFKGGQEPETYEAAHRVENPSPKVARRLGFLRWILDAFGRALSGSSRRDMRDSKLGWVRRYFVGSYQPSEWRRLKKGRVAGIAHAARPLDALLRADERRRARKARARARRRVSPPVVHIDSADLRATYEPGHCVHPEACPCGSAS